MEAHGREVERNLLIQRVLITEDSAGAYAELAAGFNGAISAELLADTPVVLAGTARQIADKLLEYRERYGITYVTAMEHSMVDFAKVIEYLR